MRLCMRLHKSLNNNRTIDANIVNIVSICRICCMCLSASKWFLFPHFVCCVCLCLFVVCVCYQKMGSWSFARCQLSHTHTHELPAATHIWGYQVASLSPYTHTHTHIQRICCPSLSLSVTLAASAWLFCTFSLIIGIHCQCFPQTFLIRQCKQNGWVCGLPTHSPSACQFCLSVRQSIFSLSHSLTRSLSPALWWPSFVSCWHFVWHSPG